MPASIAHLLIGSRVLTRLADWNTSASTAGTFLLGCMLVDVHAFSAYTRGYMHFTDDLVPHSSDPSQTSCANFLQQLDRLLVQPWSALSQVQRCFVAGYTCHLAADQPWKALSERLLQQAGAASWAEMNIPGDVSLTACDALAQQRLTNAPQVYAAL